MALYRGIANALQQISVDVAALFKDYSKIDNKSLVEMLNHLLVKLDEVENNLNANVRVIDDIVTANNHGWSISRLIQALQAAKDEIVGGAPEYFDTLKEISDFFDANDEVLRLLAVTVRTDIAQNLNTGQQYQAQMNIGVMNEPDDDIDLLDKYMRDSGGTKYFQNNYVNRFYCEYEPATV